RAGDEPVVLAEREVEVYRFVELWREGDCRGFEIECSSGTYVRSLVADLGDAYSTALRRTAIGSFAVEDADPERLIPLNEALGFLPEERIDPERARLASHGVAIEASSRAPAAGPVRLTDDQGMIAIAER